MRPNESGWRHEEARNGEPSRVIPVAPVVRSPAGQSVPRVLVVALVVGAGAFVAGLQLGAVRPPETSRVAPSPSTAVSAIVARPSSGPPAVAAGLVGGPPYTSAFAASFRPPDQFARFVGGPGCVSHNEQSEEAVGILDYVLARTWTTFCPREDWSRPFLVEELTDGIARQMPGPQQAANIATDGTTLVLYPYVENGFIGTVTLSAATLGSGFQIVISLRERRAP